MSEKSKQSNEQRYFDSLKRIARSDSLAFLRNKSEKIYGAEYLEALEFSYENLQALATNTITRKRRPKT